MNCILHSHDIDNVAGAIFEAMDAVRLTIGLGRAVARALIEGGVYIHAFVLPPTNFYLTFTLITTDFKRN